MACQKRPVIIYGAGGHATSVADIALSTGRVVRAFVDPFKGGRELLGVPVVSAVTEIDEWKTCEFAIAVGDNSTREKVFLEACLQFENISFPVLVHSTASVSSTAVLERGTVVGTHASVGPCARIGKFCILNTKSSVDHDCILADFSSLAPAACTGGSVHIGLRSAVCINATVKHGLHVGSDCVVGACSYLNINLESNALAFGTPARLVRNRTKGDSYLH